MNNLILDDLVLARGDHGCREAGVCAMEAVAWLAGEPHSDHPQCACPVIAQLVRMWNDTLPDKDRTRLLRPLLLILIGTRSTREVEVRRAYMALDWLVRTYTATWLRLAKLDADADALVALSTIADRRTAQDAGNVLRTARDHVGASNVAGWIARQAANRTVADGGAYATERAATLGLDWDAAEATLNPALAVATRAAICGATLECDFHADYYAHYEALRPTRAALQESMVALIRRMCEVRA